MKFKSLPSEETPKIVAVHHVLIVDRSGSMQTIRGVTLRGINEQIQTIRNLNKTDDKEHRVTLVLFNTTAHTVLFNAPAGQIRELKEEDYETSGGTALYDTIGRVFRRVLAEAEREDTNVLATVITDGEERDSKRFKKLDINGLIHTVEKIFGWTVTYIGANQNVEEVVRDLGISASNAAFYTASNEGATSAFFNMAKSRSAYAAGGCGSKATTHNLYSTDADTVADFDKP